jgi:cytochrome c oxidase cbb3-type subunit 3
MTRRGLVRVRLTALAVTALIVFNAQANETSRGPLSMAQQGPAFINARCTLCHSEDLIMQQRLDRAAWTRVVDKMIKWGAPVSPEEREFLLTYLADYYGPTADDPSRLN